MLSQFIHQKIPYFQWSYLYLLVRRTLHALVWWIILEYRTSSYPIATASSLQEEEEKEKEEEEIEEEERRRRKPFESIYIAELDIWRYSITY